jgi:hypothetical protein
MLKSALSVWFALRQFEGRAKTKWWRSNQIVSAGAKEKNFSG